MRDSAFWRIVAVVGCLGVLYVGHGLHQGGPDGLPSLVGTAHAGGVAVSTVTGVFRLYTASEDGRTLYMWQGDRAGSPLFLSEAKATAQFTRKLNSPKAIPPRLPTVEANP